MYLFNREYEYNILMQYQTMCTTCVTVTELYYVCASMFWQQSSIVGAYGGHVITLI